MGASTVLESGGYAEGAPAGHVKRIRAEKVLWAVASYPLN